MQSIKKCTTKNNITNEMNMKDSNDNDDSLI